MNRIITPEETEELFSLCEKYGVFFYDVQIELVDHLASLIEEQWKKYPEISFQQGLKSAVLSFGKSNFTKFAREKEKRLTENTTCYYGNILLSFTNGLNCLFPLFLHLGFFCCFK
jgi:hypothetical protein